MPITFTNAISKELSNKDQSPLDNTIPTKTTGGIKATDMFFILYFIKSM